MALRSHFGSSNIALEFGSIHRSVMERPLWEQSLDAGGGWEGEVRDSDSDFSDDDPTWVPSHEEAGRLLIDFLLDLHFRGFSARSLCVILYWARLAGASVGTWGMRPDAQSGHFQRHIDQKLGVRSRRQSMFKLPLPMYQKHLHGRTIREVPVQVPHEVLDAEARADIYGRDTLARAQREGSLPPAYYESGGGDGVGAAALYTDGVQFQKKDSVLGLWIYNVLDGTRHLCVPLRKSWLCRCGCRGWCTLVVAFEFLRWSLECAKNGVFPETGFRGVALTGHRLAQAGTQMVTKFVVLFIKGDWASFAHDFGLPSWATSLSPCCWCMCTRADWFSAIAGMESVLDELPWPTFTAQDYRDAVEACENSIRIDSVALHTRVIANLHFDQRRTSESIMGRCLKSALPDLGLQVGDRLEQSREVPDVHKFDEQRNYPFVAVFWRRSRETAARHSNPFLHFASPSAMVPDMLHVVFLGIAQAYIAAALWLLIDANVWGITHFTRDEFEVRSVDRLRHDLLLWYASRRPVANRLEGTTELDDISLSMLGTTTSPLFKAKGAETKGVLPFVIGLLERNMAMLPPRAQDLLVAGTSLMDVIRVQTEGGPVLSIPECERMFVSGVRHVRAAFRGGVHPVPKHHAFLHILHLAPEKGNPRMFACWEDESMNRQLAGVAAAAYSTVWEARIIEHMNNLSRKARAAA